MLIDTDHPYLVYVAVTFFALLCRENCPITGAGLGKNFLFLVNVKGTSIISVSKWWETDMFLHRYQNWFLHKWMMQSKRYVLVVTLSVL